MLYRLAADQFIKYPTKGSVLATQHKVTGQLISDEFRRIYKEAAVA
jgi:hypothetical protein